MSTTTADGFSAAAIPHPSSASRTIASLGSIVTTTSQRGERRPALPPNSVRARRIGVADDQLEAGGQQVAGHRPPHVAEADEADDGHSSPSSCSTASALRNASTADGIPQ